MQTEPSRFDASQRPRRVSRDGGKQVDLRSVGVRFMAWGEETGGGFSLVEHPIPPRTLVAPVHRHSREDEYSFVLEGRIGALLGEEVVYAEAGELVFKPRDQWHTFWNPDRATCRILEIISPGGFEHFFDELANALQHASGRPPAVAQIEARYGIEFQLDSVPRLCAEHQLDHPLLQAHAES